MLAATPPVVLAIAAHDPLGGAGLAADLTTFAAFGVHGTVAVTAVTAQHLRSVDRVEPMDSGLVADQIDAIADTFSIAGVKTGLLGSAAIVEVVADRIEAGVLPAPVVDPVLVDGRGHRFVGEEIEQAIASAFFQRRWRSPRTSARHRCSPDARWRASSTSTRSLTNSPALAPPMWSSPADPTARPAVDVLVRADGTIDHLESPWIDTVHVRGSGCTFAAATAAALARGEDAVDAIRQAKAFVTDRLRASQWVDLGGPARLPTGSPGEWSGARRVGGRASVDVLPFLAIVKAELRAGLDVDQREELGTIELHVW